MAAVTGTRAKITKAIIISHDTRDGGGSGRDFGASYGFVIGSL